MVSKNFIPAHKLIARQRRLRLRLWGAGCISYAAVLLAVYAICFWLWGVDGKAMAAQLAETTARIDTHGQRVNATQAELDTAELTLAVNQTVSEQPDWSVLLVLLARSLDEDVVLRQCELKPQAFVNRTASPADQSELADPKDTDYVLRLAGYARTQAAVSRFILRMEETGLFERVKLIRTRRERFLSEDVAAFEAQCLLAGREGQKQ